MGLQNETTLTKDAAAKKIHVMRAFNAPVGEVWDAWTKPEILDKWWAPKPWRAETKSMDFREGGTWLYAMIGPEGEKQNCRADYEKIVDGKSFSGLDAFCDDNGNVNMEMPRMHWYVVFNESGNHTKVEVDLTFNTTEELEKILEMGFQEGFTMAHSNLDELLAKK